jgi:hypothetical protein
MSSPWGKIDYSKKYCTGFSFVGTPGHGGLRISEKMLKKHAANFDLITRLGGQKMGQYWFFEEDCAYGLLLLDCPQLLTIFVKSINRDETEIRLSLEKSTLRWFPKYFENNVRVF